MRARVNITRKWRPPLAMVLFGALALMATFTLASVLTLRAIVPDMGWGVGLALVGCGLFALTVALAWLLSRLILRPVRALGAQAAQPRGSDARRALAHYGTQELRDMGEAVLDMASRLQAQVQDLRAYSDHVTHELRSPLTTLAAAAELLEDPGLSDEDRSKLTARVAQATARMQDLLDALQALARAEGQSDAPLIDLTPIARAAAQHSQLDITISGPIMARLAPGAAQAIFEHLSANAAQHGAGHLCLLVQDGGVVLCDDGPGISDGNLPKIFDPFFTTRREAGGTGMGLAIVRRMIDAHGGSIAAKKTQNGAKFFLQLPV